MKNLLTAITGLLVCLQHPVTVADTTATSLNRGNIQMPRVLSAQDQKQAIRPSHKNQVAVLKVLIKAEDGKARGIELKSIKLINSFAPKVFARQAKHQERPEGWRISIRGERSTSYYVNNPLQDIEIENPEGSKSPYSMVKASGDVDWTIVVPLYRKGQLLGAKDILIEDTQNQAVKLSARVDNLKLQK